MEKINFTEEEKRQIVQKLKAFFNEELEQDIGGFDAEFLIDFFADEVGAYFYNRGLYDAQALLSKKFDELADTIYELERPVSLGR